MAHNVVIADTGTLEAAPRRGDGGATAGGPGEPSAALARGALAAAPTLVAVALLAVASWSDGAFALKSWGPLAIFALVALAAGHRNGLRGPGLAMVAALWALGLWALVSLLWSPSPGSGVLGGGRALLYAALASLPLVTLPSRRWAVLTAYALTAAAAAIVVGTYVACLLDGPAQFLAGRLDDPVGYRNGSAVLFVLAFWPLVGVAARRDVHPLLRSAAFGVGVLSLGLAFLTQSRGAVVGLAAGAVVALALGPDRLRRAWLALLALGALGLAAGRLLEPYDLFLDTGLTQPAAVRDAVGLVGLLAAGSFLVALLITVFDAGLRLSPRHQRALRAAGVAGLAAVALAGAAAGLAATGDPVRFAREKVDEFRRVDLVAPTRTRLTATGGQRSDLYRIAWAQFRSDPLLGAGEAGYAARYYRERRTDSNLSDPHSLPLRVLAENGLVGALLLAAALVAAALALARGWSGASPAQRRTASAMAAAGAVLLAQASLDWLWLIPGLTGLGLLSLATAVAVVALPDRPPDLPAPGRRPLRVAGRVLPALAAALVAVLFLSDVYVRSARAKPAGASEARLAAGRTAERLNPLALPPHYQQAGALEELGRVPAARDELHDALRLEPGSFVTMTLLGDLETRAGDREAARAWYRRALALNPRDIGLQQLAR